MFIKHGRVGPGVGALGAQDRVIVAAYWEALTRLCGRSAALIGWVVARPRRRPETQSRPRLAQFLFLGAGGGGVSNCYIFCFEHGFAVWARVPGRVGY